ncbi:MAG: non-ribosomal peptide synthetase [Leptolyngbyaceae cyanobacterium]
MQLEKLELVTDGWLNQTSVHHYFEEQVKLTPDAVAVVFGDQKLTYQQLNQRANRLGNHLSSLGVSPEVLVGIYIDRSLEMIVGLLGIMKAGGAYVPLDSTYPSERTAFILKDTQVKLILTLQKFKERLPLSQADVICLDSDWDTIAQYSPANLSCNISTDNLMYVIYTSGSTGKPKGVMITHRGICNQLHWRQATFPLSPHDRVLQNISFSFDPSVWQIFWPLTCGAQLVLPKPAGHQDIRYLVELIAQQQITVIALVPSMLRVLLEQENLGQCTYLKHIFCGGEALSLDLQQRFFERIQSGTLLHNVYGPTEASIDATFWTCTPTINSSIAPIGHAITNAEVYVLDDQLKPALYGEAGELYIGGMGLARGYLNRPELTAERFVPFSYGLQGDTRLYKTGDLVKYLPDGSLEFLGRIDHQVKIRGFRIELGEIETALNQHSAIKQAIVTAYEYSPGDKRLIAYWVAANGAEATTPHELRQFLQQTLPSYMIPAAFVQLEALPLMPNGKVDRRALPEPDQTRLESRVAFAAPRNELEIELTEIWEKVLNIHPIGIHDNFLELGGNSLLGLQIFAQIEEKFDKKIPLATLFQEGTIHKLSRLLADRHWQGSWDSLVAIQPKGTRPPFFCVHGLDGQVLYFHRLAYYLGEDHPFYALQPQGLNGQQTIFHRVEEMASHYLQEMQTIQSTGPYFIGGHSFGGVIAYEMAQQLHKQGQEVALLVLFDTYRLKLLPPALRYFLHIRNLFKLKPKQQLAYLQKRLKNVEDKVSNKLEKKESDLREINQQAYNNYRAHPYSGRSVLFKADEDLPESLQALLKLSEAIDDQLGWGKLFPNGLEVQQVTGDHSTILYEPHVRQLAESLKGFINRALIE